jgi:valyl-tRNA synthetase
MRDVERLFNAFQYGEAGRQIYEFFWSEFADWYLEIAKLQMADGGDRAYYTAETLVRVLDATLRMLHPFTPFITEELWGHLRRAAEDRGLRPIYGETWPEALIIAPWPEGQSEEPWEAPKVAEFELVQEIIRAIRNLRAERKVTPGRRIAATIVAGDRIGIVQEQARTIGALAYLDPGRFTIMETLPEKPQGVVSMVVSGVELYLPLAGLVDTSAERTRLEAELKDIQSQIDRLEGLLSSPFAQKAPPAVVDKERQKLATYQETAGKLRAQLETLGE